MNWNVVLQMNHPNRGGIDSICRLETVLGIGLPIHVHLLSCQSSMESKTKDVFNSIANQLNLPINYDRCYGPVGGRGGWGDGLKCMAWDESACRHVLVMLTDGSSLDTQAEQLALDWRGKAGTNGIIIPVLATGVGSSSLPTSLRNMNRLSDLGNNDALAADILRWIHIDADRKIFLSYRRDDSKVLADQIHHALIQRGYRVYLDRFSGTPGRFFPQEIAEELADKGCVLLLESQNLVRSRWTRWEIAFARHYRLGLMALNVDGASHISGIQPSDRKNVSTNRTNGELSSTELDKAINFITQRYSINSIARRVFYEELLRRTSSSEGIRFKELGAGTYELSSNGKTALVYPCGRPGGLPEVHHTAEFMPSTGSPSYRILAGQHQHLPIAASKDLAWLAQLSNVLLRRPYQLFESLRNFSRGVSP